jgi:hypothetical protein
MANSENKFKLITDLCTALSDHAKVSRVVGAAHVAINEEDIKRQKEEDAKPYQSGVVTLVPESVQIEEDERRKRREVCDSNYYSNNKCNQFVRLSTRFLRTGRQVYLDAALLP